MKISEILRENDAAAQAAADSQTLAQAFRSGQMAPSQLMGHPKWFDTYQAMKKKYPNMMAMELIQITKDAIAALIKQGQ